MAIELRIEENHALRIVRVFGEVDLYHSHRLKETITELAAVSRSGILLDLGAVGYIDSSGVGVLIFAKALCGKKGIPLRIINAKGPVLRVLELTKLTSYLPLAESEEVALHELERGWETGGG